MFSDTIVPTMARELDEIRMDLDSVADDASPDVAGEIRSIRKGLTNIPEDKEARRTQFRETEDRISEIEHQADRSVAERLHTLQEDIHVLAEDVGY
ncbi:hypothetical protein ZOD2009_11570 [Haladaptatus paucihalophilus DX253]|uniref:Uncharacterized protein n=2 Tax=Haladaptatus paucihalophilus DX253 TaxID=797209 RepID=E7QU34_HALPU|nr:hypothetical protein ZOD2009_11570 [Haladaptatus paucihalophilus DX253]